MSAYLGLAMTWLRAKASEFSREESGGGEIIATVVVIAVVIVLGIAFQSQIVEFFGTLWEQATGGAGQIGTGGKP